jgi:hypothetical protein
LINLASGYLGINESINAEITKCHNAQIHPSNRLRRRTSISRLRGDSRLRISGGVDIRSTSASARAGRREL